MPRDFPHEAGGAKLRRNPKATWCCHHKYCVHLGFALPQKPASADGWGVGFPSGGIAMNNLDPREVEKLIGGYATGTLTEAEQQALFSEALGNQALFDALADEEALRDLLADPVARRQLLGTLTPEQKQASVLARFSAWFFRPMTMTLAAGAAAAGLAVLIVPRLTESPKVEHVAMSRGVEAARDAAPQQPGPEQAIAPSPAEKDRAAQPRVAPFAREAAPAPAREKDSGMAGALSGPPASAPAPAPQPAVAAPPRADAPLADAMREQERKIASARQEEVAQAPAATAQAPQAAAPATAAPPAPKEAPVQKTMAAKSSLAATLPFEYVLERQGVDGSWSGIEPTARLSEKDQVRVAVQANARGSLTVDVQLPGGATRNLYRAAIQAGQRFHVPAQGGLPAGEGEHRLVISYSGVGSTLGSAGFRQRAAAENRAAKTESSRDNAGAAAPYRV